LSTENPRFATLPDLIITVPGLGIGAHSLGLFSFINIGKERKGASPKRSTRVTRVGVLLLKLQKALELASKGLLNSGLAYLSTFGTVRLALDFGFEAVWSNMGYYKIYHLLAR